MRYLLLLIITIAIGCKQVTSSSSSSSKGSAVVLPISEKWMLSNQSETSDSLAQVARANAGPILEHRIKESKTGVATGMDKDLWVVDAILKGSKMIFGTDVNGFWIDFKDNNLYEYGNFEVIKGQGKYHFDVDKNIMLLLDADSRIKAQEFQTILTNDALVLVGSSIYGDNNMQAKFQRKPAMPVKPVKQPLVE